MDMVSLALSGTQERGNTDREFHISITLIGLAKPLRGVVDADSHPHVAFREYELSRNGSWVAVEAPPRYILREGITSAQILYLDGVP
ncbi:hypothetical protein FROZEN_44 [Erwinia phage vB_EamP_Frozen]|uniref:Uncharacterized protein n=2 Tax=Johnsonvirus frozen TaxID=1982578 RepID=A0A191ZD83_9CAUD|nr:hypothetical protein FROZEN_44 [Erwinia phage vB_EamP_Frozen]ANJ65174.1 hypothetical protein FROZEN_44 [Erwinia phage vB_EamP_Frozen]ANJ65350.1 hypothetical protein GUTMEISTER_36 [Erwinia phage vB_EamP_Gutmeister]